MEINKNKMSRMNKESIDLYVTQYQWKKKYFNVPLAFSLQVIRSKTSMTKMKCTQATTKQQNAMMKSETTHTRSQTDKVCHQK